MALLEHEAQRFAETLDDYENLSILDIGGTYETGFWLVAHDDLLEAACEISSQLDYWNFVFRHAVGRPSGAATLPAKATA